MKVDNNIFVEGKTEIKVKYYVIFVMGDETFTLFRNNENGNVTRIFQEKNGEHKTYTSISLG